MSNPFSLSFGKEPNSFINRIVQEEEIINDFNSDNPSNHVYMITGVRGSGKTVFMTKISKEFQKNDSWIIVDAIPENNIVEYIVAKLQSDNFIKNILKEIKINISIPGVDISFGKDSSIIKNSAVALEKLVEQITKKKKNLLICIDEVVANKNIKEFVSLFQVLLRKEFNIYLIMTGLYENIYELQNEKTLTFLYRAPRIVLEELNINKIALNYKNIFNLSEEDAKEMSSMTKGYPFAYQVLGYLCYKNNKNYLDVIDDYDMYLEEFVYEKIWNELSKTDKTVLIMMKNNEKVKNEILRKKLDMNPNLFNEYRTRLIRKGIIKSSEYAHLSFVLPRFKEFINRRIQD